MNLRSDDPRITAYVFDELIGVELSTFESEMAASEELRELVDQTRVTTGCIQDELAREPELRLSDRQRMAIVDVSGLAELHPESTQDGRRRRWRRVLGVGVLAASVVCILLIPISYRQRTQPESFAIVDDIGYHPEHPDSAQETSWLNALPLPTQTTTEPATMHPSTHFYEDVTITRSRSRRDSVPPPNNPRGNPVTNLPESDGRIEELADLTRFGDVTAMEGEVRDSSGENEVQLLSTQAVTSARPAHSYAIIAPNTGGDTGLARSKALRGHGTNQLALGYGEERGRGGQGVRQGGMGGGGVFFAIRVKSFSTAKVSALKAGAINSPRLRRTAFNS